MSVLAVALVAAGVLAIPIRGKPLALRWKHFVRDLVERVSGRPVRPPPPGWTPFEAK